MPGEHVARSPAARFNASHSAVRSVVERCIGLLKARFRCLQRYRTLVYAPVIASTIVAACAVLHNLCLYYECPEPDSTGDDEEGTDDGEGTNDEEGADDEAQEGPAELARRGREQRDQLLRRFS